MFSIPFTSKPFVWELFFFHWPLKTLDQVSYDWLPAITGFLPGFHLMIDFDWVKLDSFQRHSLCFWCLFRVNHDYGVFARFYRVFLGFTGFYWFFLGFTGFNWVLLDFTWFLAGFTGFYWVLLTFTVFYCFFSRFYWALLGFTGFY